MLQEIIIAGFGGQGVMSMGQLLAYAGMLEGKHVSWIPSYGPEMRGGTANCAVTISDMEIGSPIVSEPNSVIVLNLPSLIKFEPTLVPGGLLLLNTLVAGQKYTRKDVSGYEIPAVEIADRLGNTKVANMVMLGAYLKATNVVSVDSVIESLKKVLPQRRHNLIPLNRQALELGASELK
ncbi:MAG: 2-oxoacid:ferredoxin oxidoreductase subunit gamma [Desulfitibacter sp. BRH_c19]|nr:MAG: 2-oxoacid:ferredoxin oxidoreductase subunit gamma [Desulfitibacter sp. BRH_c19]